MESSSVARISTSRRSLLCVRDANRSCRVPGGRCCLPGLKGEVEDGHFFVLLPSSGRGLQRQQCRGLCKFVRRLEHARRKRRMVAAGATLLSDRKRAGAYVATPDPLLALTEGSAAKNEIAREFAILNDIHRTRCIMPVCNTVYNDEAMLATYIPSFQALKRDVAAGGKATAGSLSCVALKRALSAPPSGGSLPGLTLFPSTGGGQSNVVPAQIPRGAEHAGRSPSSSRALGREGAVHTLKATKTSTDSSVVLRPLENIPVPSGPVTCMQLHRIACMPSAKHMTAYLLVFSKTAIRPADAPGYLAVLRRLAADAGSLDSRSLWRACAAVRNFRKARECSWTVEETARAEQFIAAEFEKGVPVDALSNGGTLQERTAVEIHAQLQKLVSDGEEAVIDAFVRAAAVLLQQRVDLRLASHLLSCFALDFHVFYLPFYAHISRNFTRQRLRASAEELAQTAFAFASLQLRDTYLFEKIAEAAQSILPSFSIEQLSRLLMSFVLVEIQCYSLLVAAGPHLERLAQHCCAEEIGRIAFTHARAGVCTPAVRRLLVARVPTALCALTEASQVADLLVSSRRLQLQLPLSLQVHVAEQLHLNDLDGQSFAAVLLALLPLKSLSPVFWQDAAASCLLRVLMSTPSIDRKALLLRVQGEATSGEDRCPATQETSTWQSYSESSHALSPAATVDCFVCFATIFGASPVDAGCGTAVASTEQHNCIAVVLAGLSHALCSSRRGNEKCRGIRQINVEQNGNPNYSYTPVMDMLQPTDVVRVYRALRRMRSSWDVERLRWHFKSETRRICSSRNSGHSDRYTHSTCAAAIVSPENAARSHSSDVVSRRHDAEQASESEKGELATRSKSVQLVRWIDEEVATMFLEDRGHVSLEEARFSQRFRDRLAAQVSAEQAATCRRQEDSSLDVEEQTMVLAEASLPPAISEGQPVSAELAEWMTSLVLSAQRYSARYLDPRDQGRAVEQPLLHAEDMAAALVCSYTQRDVWHSLERVLMRRFLLMLCSDVFSVPDMLSCAYSLFCLYPYGKHRRAPFLGPQLDFSRTGGRSNGLTRAPPHPTNASAAVSSTVTSKESISQTYSQQYDVSDCSPNHRRAKGTNLPASLMAPARETGRLAAPLSAPGAAPAKEFLLSTLINAVVDDVPEDGVLAVVCQRVVAALRNAYVRAWQDGTLHGREQHCSRRTHQSAAGEKAVAEALNTLEPYQQHALCSLIIKYVPAMPSFLLKALPRLSAAPVPAGGGDGHRNFISSSCHASGSLIHPKSQVSFTSPTVGAELERLLQLAGISVQCFQRMHRTAATVFTCSSTTSNLGPPQHFTKQGEHTDCPVSHCQLPHLLCGKAFCLDGAQVLQRAAPQVSARGVDTVQAVDEGTVNCAPSVAASTVKLTPSLTATKQNASSLADILLPHVASGGDGPPYVLKSEVGAMVRLLQAEGWQLVFLPFCIWRLLSDEKEKLTFLLDQRRRLLHEPESKASCEDSFTAFPRKCSTGA